MALQMKARGAEGKLDASAWTEAALEQLASAGIDGVRIEILAKRLEVTKGSFYWHFKDRDALLTSMLTHWRRRATISLIERLDRGETSASDRLRRLLRLPLAGKRSAWGANVELEMQVWALKDPRAKAVLEEVDQLRLHYITDLLVDCGFARDEANARAVLAYSYMRAAAMLVRADETDVIGRCEALLLN